MNNMETLQPRIGSRSGMAVPFGRNGSFSQRPAVSEFLALIGEEGTEEEEGVGLGTACDQEMPVLLHYLRAGDPLFHEGSPTGSIHFVRSGTFKVFRTSEDGYEQVLGFAMRGEVLGFDALCLPRRPTAALALEDSSTYAVRMDDLFALGGRFPALAQGVHRAASNAMKRCLEVADLMAAVAAEVRLARFLLLMSREVSARGHSAHFFHLRMGRREIASYLGVAHETISRCFTELANWGMVSVSNREVGILDMDGLQMLARATRRQVDELGKPAERRELPAAQAQQAS